ncbi:MAG: hypothetical protein MUC59_12095, partial [Saprospiraceae bacterium]|nr:hypothetical protein [Saprospiraceae bacterium]
ILPSKKSTTGSGQVTVVAPIGFVYVGLENYGGTWIENARVDGPMEAPETSYISFGFVSDEPRIKYAAGKETLLFTFVVEDAAAKISLIDNENDPFLEPNTYGTNPGNDLGVIDFDRNGSLLVYNYSGNIDMDTISTKSIYANEKNDDGKEKSSSEYKAVFASEKIATPGQ